MKQFYKLIQKESKEEINKNIDILHDQIENGYEIFQPEFSIFQPNFKILFQKKRNDSYEMSTQSPFYKSLKIFQMK